MTTRIRTRMPTLRDRLAEAVAKEAAFSGWTSGGMRERCRAGRAPAPTPAACSPAARSTCWPTSPGGPTSARSSSWRRRVDELRTRDRIALGVKLRIQNTVGGKESVRRGLALLALPFNGPLALRLLYRTVDAIWYAAGDTSTDFNFYSKRALLAGVFSSTLLYWLNDRSEGDEATWGFLDRRIDNVMSLREAEGPAAKGRRPLQRAGLDQLAKLISPFTADQMFGLLGMVMWSAPHTLMRCASGIEGLPVKLALAHGTTRSPPPIGRTGASFDPL